MKRLVFTVTNQLSFDQRMIRICTSLTQAGYAVTLIGVRHKDSGAIQQQPFTQKRLFCFFRKGAGFYAEYNIRLFFCLLFIRCHLLCCIDLDTLLPNYAVAKLRRKKLVYDAHEYFSQQKEIITRPRVYKVWHWIERTFVPRIANGYTVSHSIAQAFRQQYGVDYQVIMNATVLKPMTQPDGRPAYMLYQGAVNEARGLEQLIPAMQHIDATLHIYGDGNYLAQCKALIAQHQLQQKVLLQGKVLPAALDAITANAVIGINLVENNGLNQYYSLANKFFDYMHQCIPQVTMAFPEYERINNSCQVALLIPEVTEQNIITAVNLLLKDNELYKQLQLNCRQAREQFNWQQEEQLLLEFYKRIID